MVVITITTAIVERRHRLVGVMLGVMTAIAEEGRRNGRQRRQRSSRASRSSRSSCTVQIIVGQRGLLKIRRWLKI